MGINGALTSLCINGLLAAINGDLYAVMQRLIICLSAVYLARVPRKNENPFVHINYFSYLYALICIMQIMYL